MNVILVVDMIRGFHDLGKLANPRTAKIIPNIRELLERKTKEGGWVALFLADKHKLDDKEFDMFPPHCVEGTEETEVVAELRQFCQHTVLSKTRHSGFYKTQLDDFLEFEKPQKVVVVGVCTDICVLYTVAGLRERDFKVIVPKNCTETYSSSGHGARRTKRWVFRHMRDVLGVNVIKSQKEI